MKKKTQETESLVIVPVSDIPQAVQELYVSLLRKAARGHEYTDRERRFVTEFESLCSEDQLKWWAVFRNGIGLSTE